MASEMKTRIEAIITEHRHTHEPIAIARLVLEAMVEPTDDMLKAGKGMMPVEYDFRSMRSWGGEEFPEAVRMVVVGFAPPADQASPEGVWRAMLAKAES